MPIYEYRCTECKFQEEYLQKVSEPPLTLCPSCGKQSFNKLLSAAGFQLKGSGWYATDFRNKGGASAGSADKTPANDDNKSAPSKDAGGESDGKKAGKSEAAASTAASTTASTPVTDS